MNAIPRTVALELCRQIRQAQIAKWYSWFLAPCSACALLSNGDPEQRFVTAESGYRGCALVNARYADLQNLPLPAMLFDSGAAGDD